MIQQKKPKLLKNIPRGSASAALRKSRRIKHPLSAPSRRQNPVQGNFALHTPGDMLFSGLGTDLLHESKR